jgi:putative ABC transport system permease protein
MDKQFGLYRGDIKRSGVRVIGIINNYNYRSLRYTIEPVIFFVDPNAYRYMEIKISPDKLPGTLNLLKQKWAQTFPNYPFDFTFLDQSIMVEYESDIITGKIFDIFSLLSILIGCLGLLGLVSYSVEKRTKEIGIRKVLGSSVKEIVILLSKDLLMPVIISGFIAAPVSYYFIHNWLEQFAFKIKINPLDIIISACAVFLIAFLTIIFHSVKAANANPVHSLRYE